MTASSGSKSSSKKSALINFEKARLILVDNTSSYVELNSPDDFSTKCLLCNKTTAHDHDIIGKLKFDPKYKSYLVSLVEKKKFQGSTSSKNLDIIPMRNSKNSPVKNTEDVSTNDKTNTHNNSKNESDTKQNHHVYPVTVPDEATGAKYFAEELSKNSKTNAAIKVSLFKIEISCHTLVI